MTIDLREIRKEKGGWQNQLYSDAYHKLLFDGLPGWDLGVEGYPLEAKCLFTFRDAWSSRKTAIETDDWCRGQFYYRDHTLSGMPWGNNGEKYLSTFVFQLTKDYLEFHERYALLTDQTLIEEILEWQQSR